MTTWPMPWPASLFSARVEYLGGAWGVRRALAHETYPLRLGHGIALGITSLCIGGAALPAFPDCRLGFGRLEGHWLLARGQQQRSHQQQWNLVYQAVSFGWVWLGTTQRLTRLQRWAADRIAHNRQLWRWRKN